MNVPKDGARMPFESYLVLGGVLVVAGARVRRKPSSIPGHPLEVRAESLGQLSAVDDVLVSGFEFVLSRGCRLAFAPAHAGICGVPRRVGEHCCDVIDKVHRQQFRNPRLPQHNIRRGASQGQRWSR